MKFAWIGCWLAFGLSALAQDGVSSNPPPAGPVTAAVTVVEVPALSQPAPAPNPILAVALAQPVVPLLPMGSSSNLVSLQLDNVPVVDVLRMFTRLSGANIIISSNVTGNVSVNMQNVEWEPALKAILDSVGLVLVQKNSGIYSVITTAEMEDEPLVSETFFLQYSTVSNIQPALQSLLVSSNASCVAISSANALLIQERASRLSLIKDALQRIDKPYPQVIIEAKFVELNDSAIKDLGINWQSLANYQITAGQLEWSLNDARVWNANTKNNQALGDSRSQANGVNRSLDIDNSDSVSLLGPKTVGKTLIDGSVGTVINDNISRSRDVTAAAGNTFDQTLSDTRAAVLTASDFALVLSALRQNGGVQIVSNPKIIVASGVQAMIHVGTKEPQIRSTYNADSKTTEYLLDKYIDVGVIVHVTPVVNSESNISLRIVPELSRKLADVPAGDGKISFPRLSTRTVSTDFNMESGRTVAIGGLTQTTDQEKTTKIPLLGDIPLIGKYLFSHTHTEKEQDEIIIFVTVSMARPAMLQGTSGIPGESSLYNQYKAKADAARKEARLEAQKKAKPKMPK